MLLTSKVRWVEIENGVGRDREARKERKKKQTKTKAKE
jgi:hypothetical protein